MSSCSASEAGTNNDSLKTGGGPEIGSRRDINDGIAGVMSLGVWCSANRLKEIRLEVPCRNGGHPSRETS